MAIAAVDRRALESKVKSMYSDVAPTHTENFTAKWDARWRSVSATRPRISIAFPPMRLTRSPGSDASSIVVWERGPLGGACIGGAA